MKYSAGNKLSKYETHQNEPRSSASNRYSLNDRLVIEAYLAGTPIDDAISIFVKDMLVRTNARNLKSEYTTRTVPISFSA